MFFLNVGGDKRDKGGIGVTEEGFEKVINRHNPWEILGYQFIDEAALLFNKHSYSESYNVLDRAFKSITQENTEKDHQPPVLKEEFHAARKWLEVYKEWDNFNHKKSLSSLKEIKKHQNNLKNAFKSFDLDFEKNIKQAEKYLNKIYDNTTKGEVKNSPYLIFDLIMNAERKANQWRFDDAAARLYRAIEAMAQYRLQKKYGVDSAKVCISSLTPELKKKYKHGDSPVKLALQDNYLFLSEKSDDLGQKFDDLDLSSDDHKGSVLSIRNKSILAHGYEPMSKDSFECLLKKTHKLFDVLKAEEFDFENTNELFPQLK